MLLAKVEDDEAWATTRFAPLGAMYVATALEAAGYAVEIWHGPAAELSDLYDLAESMDPIYVGFSTHTMKNLSGAVAASRELHSTGFTVVWGGVHATIMPHICLDAGYTDYVVRREGEVAAVRLADELSLGALRALRSISLIPGVSSKGHISGFTERIENLDRYSPAWRLVDVERYMVPSPWGRRVLPVVTSRGCPYRCGFCFSPIVYQRRYTRHTAQWVERHIDRLIERYSIDGVSFRDENLFADPNYGRRVARMLHSRGLKWYVPIRADTLARDPGLGEWMWRHGCRAVYIGAESGSQRVLDVMRKGVTPRQILDAAGSFEGTSVEVGAGFIYGTPGETDEDRRETYAVIDELYGMDIELKTYLACYTPYPATPLWGAALESGFNPPWTDEGWAMDRDQVPEVLPWVDRDRYVQTRTAMSLAHKEGGGLRRFLRPLEAWRWRRRCFSCPVEARAIRAIHRLRGASP